MEKARHDIEDVGGEANEAAPADHPKKPEQLDVASTYGNAGIKVFPCRPRDKKPIIKDNLNSATDDNETISRWWKSWPNALVGLPCGQNRLFVLDFDYYKPNSRIACETLKV